MIKKISVAELRDLMQETVIRFLFVKSDGSMRVAFGTLCGRIIKDNGAEPDSSKTRSSKPSIVTYFDIEKSAWRSFVETRLVGLDEDYGL